MTPCVGARLEGTIKLEPGTVRETVTITGNAPLVDTASTTLGGVVNSQQVNSLPMNGRDLVELLALVPGMVLRAGATQQSINGASSVRQEGGLHFSVDR